MSDNPKPLRSLLVRCAGFGAGFALTLVVAVCLIYWYMHRQKPWNTAALKGAFASMSFATRPQEDAFKMELQFDIENTTSRDYDFSPASLTILFVADDNNSLAKEAGNYQSGDASVEGPAFIPARGKARTTIHLAYFYPSEFTVKEKDDPDKVLPLINRRLKEIHGIAIFDKNEFYRIDLPAGWTDWKEVKDEAKPKK